MTNYATSYQPTAAPRTGQLPMAAWEIVFCVLGSIIGLALITLSTIAAIGSR